MDTSIINYLSSPEGVEWIQRNSAEDPSALRLKYASSFSSSPWLPAAIMQIECRARAAKKIPEEVAAPRFLFPSLLSSEQATSDSLADFHASLIQEGSGVLDLTCGLGIDTFHIARRATSLTSVEREPSYARVAEHNAAVLGLSDRVSIINSDCIDYIASASLRPDVIFVDPARRDSSGGRVYGLSDCSPDIVPLLPRLAQISPRLIVKASPMLDISSLASELPGVTDIYVTGTSTECKELIADVSLARYSDSVEIASTSPTYGIHAIVPGLLRFTFTPQQEAAAVPVIGRPKVGEILYEPHPVVMKAGPFRLLSQRWKVAKIGGNSHLYFSSEIREGFPGSAFRILEVLPYASGEIKRLARRYPVINVATRNFDVPTDALRRKLRVRDGGNLRLMATTLPDSSRIMIILSPL
ncbi:MAG: class I SAM-dependent methyltransferase [Muribaculaceae bacterium]|nr:class I SAM-dependent methyltransferase [Muribaculaceae bacterium]